MNSIPEPDDFDLTALRYLTGELSPEETEAFEQLLADDVTACERLADVVELSAAMLTAPSAPDARTTRGGLAAAPKRSFSIWSAVLAASVLLALVGGLVTLMSSGDDAQTQLAQSWIDSSDAVDQMLEVDNLLVAEQPLAPQLDVLPLDDADDASWNTPPAWMLAAVELDQEDDLDREVGEDEVNQ
ncbi:hypothetical protein LOC68_20630 [Blastopirellula sp. JC732]|uniref:Zinc-finger domain-containing protein n=1 Tax=Blastopirellula sediminis TaxID=2894196 RepID=A0A9X1SI32_9BACT|nr:hypothetical protein [Blastopirellula sediminis]MCC9605894.1 hypothetical protein [Blastopirellula sediminis]MCC9630807.1 hypothetical protein [Blastopirellula sediminis]